MMYRMFFCLLGLMSTTLECPTEPVNDHIVPTLRSSFYSPQLTSKILELSNNIDHQVCDFFINSLYNKVIVLSYLLVTHVEEIDFELIASPEDVEGIDVFENCDRFVTLLDGHGLVCDYIMVLKNELEVLLSDQEWIELKPGLGQLWDDWYNNLIAQLGD